MTILEATQKWVREMDAIQQSIISKLMSIDIDSWTEVTKPSCGDRVYVYDKGEGEIIRTSKLDGDEYIIELDDGETVAEPEYNFDVERDDLLPMWGTMWSFHDSCDDTWLDDEGLKLMSECGFRIYENEDFGYFFGIDGAGYDFYESHWIPLYKSRGLRWHDEIA